MTLPEANAEAALLALHAGLAEDEHELDGLVCACAAMEDAASSLVQLIEAHPRGVQALEQLIAQRHTALDVDMALFEPLLADDDDPLSVRAGALGAWCRGFTSTVHLLLETPQHLLRGSAGEAFEDLQRIGGALQADDPAAAYEPEDEDAYEELHEFVRVAATLAYEALRHARPQAIDASASRNPEP